VAEHSSGSRFRRLRSGKGYALCAPSLCRTPDYAECVSGARAYTAEYRELVPSQPFITRHSLACYNALRKRSTLSSARKRPRIVSGRTKAHELHTPLPWNWRPSTEPRRGSAIDNPDQTERLLARLQTALPMPALVTPEAAAALQSENPTRKIPVNCFFTAVSYAGDEGGIVCRLDFACETQKMAYVSITHLRFDPRLPLARQIAAYQKHRVKRLHRLS
jgi:hypothetical protein